MTSESDDVIKRVRSNQCRPKATEKRERRATERLDDLNLDDVELEAEG